MISRKLVMRAVKFAVKNCLAALCRRLGETSPLLLDFSSMHDGKAASLLLDSMRTAKFLEPQTCQAPKNKKVFVIAPHPDDEVIGMGGVMAQMLQQGCDVEVISLTFGDDPLAVREARKASQFLGYEFAHFFNFKTKSISLDAETLGVFSNLIQKVNPDVIFIPFMLDDHDDHRRASEMLLAAYESGGLHDFDHIHVWAYQVYTALPLNAVVNITDVIRKKIDVISCYKSRFVQRDWAHFAMGLSAFNVRFLHGNIDQDYAEVFFKTNVSNYLKMCDQYFRHSANSCYSTQHYNG